jgi:type IV secretion system protein VirB10
MTDPELTGHVPAQDVTGAGAGIALQQAPRRLGVRFSKRSKAIVIGFAAVMLALIFYGIMQAGERHAQGPTQAADDSPGQQRPDFSAMHGKAPVIPPVVPAASPATATAASNDCEKRNNSPWPCAPGRPASAAPITPGQKHQQWLLDQRYKELEDGVMARHAAIQSDVKLQNVQIAGNVPARRDATNTGDQNSGISTLAKLQTDYLKGLAGNSSNGATGNKAGIDANLAWQQDAGKNRNAGGYLPATRQAARGDHELFAGSIIPAVMVTGINSDLPGTITASVRRTVYDSRDWSAILIPQGTKLVGEYNSMVQYGQERLMVVWNELIYPDGSTLDLHGMAGTDSIGQAGFSDEVNNHYLRIFGSSALISLFGTAAQLSQPQNAGALNTPSMASQATANFATTLDTTAVNILNKNLSIAPTLNIRPGYPFNVLVNKTVVMQPWERDGGTIASKAATTVRP